MKLIYLNEFGVEILIVLYDFSKNIITIKLKWRTKRRIINIKKVKLEEMASFVCYSFFLELDDTNMLFIAYNDD